MSARYEHLWENGRVPNSPELLGHVLNAMVERISLDTRLVEDVINGTVYQVGEQGLILGRMGVFASKLPDTVPGTSVNRQCGSSLTAIQMGYGMIASNVQDVVIASGFEIMSKYPIGSDIGGTLPDGRPQGQPYGEFYTRRLHGGEFYNQAQAAQAVARKWRISRRECEEFAVASHTKAHRATENCYFKAEILPTTGLDKDGNKSIMEKDETIRPDTSLEKLATLNPVLGTEMITAGNLQSGYRWSLSSCSNE